MWVDRCRNCNAEVGPQAVVCARCGSPIDASTLADAPGSRWDDVAGLLPEGVPRDSSTELEDRLHESLTRMRPPRPWEANAAAIAVVTAARAMGVGLVLATLVVLPSLVLAVIDAIRGGGGAGTWSWLARIPLLWVAANGYAGGGWYVAAGIAWTWLAFRTGATWAETRIWHLQVPAPRRGVVLVASAAVGAAAYWVAVFVLALVVRHLLASTAGTLALPVDGPQVPYLNAVGPGVTNPLVAATGGAVVAFLTGIFVWARSLRVSLPAVFGPRGRPAAMTVAAFEGSRRFLLVALVAAMAYTVATAFAQGVSLIRGRFYSTAAIAGTLVAFLSLFVWFGLDAVILELLVAMRLFAGSVRGIAIAPTWYDIALLGIVAVAFLLGGQAAARTLERPSVRAGAVAGLGVGVVPGLLGAVFALLHLGDLDALFVLTSLVCPMAWGAVFGALGGYMTAARSVAGSGGDRQGQHGWPDTARPAPSSPVPSPPSPPLPPQAAPGAAGHARPAAPSAGGPHPPAWPDPGGPAVG